MKNIIKLLILGLSFSSPQVLAKEYGCSKCARVVKCKVKDSKQVIAFFITTERGTIDDYSFQVIQKICPPNFGKIKLSEKGKVMSKENIKLYDCPRTIAVEMLNKQKAKNAEDAEDIEEIKKSSFLSKVWNFFKTPKKNLDQKNLASLEVNMACLDARNPSKKETQKLFINDKTYANYEDYQFEKIKIHTGETKAKQGELSINQK